MSPSRSHELNKKATARLLEIYLEEKQAGKKYDEYYCIGADKNISDLAIKVIYTSGGMDTLEIYKRLGVKEVWFLQDKQLKIYCFQDDTYQQQQSELLPDLNLKLLAQHIAIADSLRCDY